MRAHYICLKCYERFFFAVSLERWCRLRGNLLFYFKSKDPWSEPIGVVVLEHCQVRLDLPNVSTTLPTDNQFPFYLGRYYILIHIVHE